MSAVAGRFALAVLLTAALGWLGWALRTIYLWSPEAERTVQSARPMLPGAHAPPVPRPQRLPLILGEPLAAGRALDAVQPVLTRDGFTLGRINCGRNEGTQLCAVCSTGPGRELGATLVRCTDHECYWPLAVSEYERAGWNGESECLVRDEEP